MECFSQKEGRQNKTENLINEIIASKSLNLKLFFTSLESTVL
jgi:hypothetical protein